MNLIFCEIKSIAEKEGNTYEKHEEISKRNLH